MDNAMFISKKCINIINISSIVTLHYFEFPHNYTFPGESHSFWEILYVDKGEFLVNTNEPHFLKQGDVIFHKPNEFHDNHACNNSSANIFVISFVCQSKAMKFFENKALHLSKQYRQLIGNIIDMGHLTYESSFNDVNAKELIQRPDSIIGGQQMIKLYLEQLLLQLLQEDIKTSQNTIYQSSEDFDDVLINEIINLLKDNVYGNINISDICKNMNYSKTYLSVFFKKQTGKTMIEYYRYLKIKEAKILLRNNQHSISEISQLLYFTSPYYFSNVFKAYVKMSPKEYKALAVKNYS